MNEDFCPICMEEIVTLKNTVLTECNHKFHTSCLMKSVAFNGFACPCCRDVMAMAREGELSEDEDEDEDEDEYEEYGDFCERMDEEDTVLSSFRWLFNRLENEPTEEMREEGRFEVWVQEQADEVARRERLDDIARRERLEEFPFPVAIPLILKSLVEQGVTMEDLLTSHLYGAHEEYQVVTDYNRIDRQIYRKIRFLIAYPP